MKILGLTSFIHNSSAALLIDGQVVAAADEERFTRNKFTGDFPLHAVRFCLDRASISSHDLDCLAFYWNPWAGLPHRLGMMLRHLPHSLAFFQKNVASGTAVRGDFRSWWQMVNLRRVVRQMQPLMQRRIPVHYVNHHLAHAASAYYLSPWDDSLILSLDGTGEWTTTLTGRGTGSRIEKYQQAAYPHSLGVLYGAITQFLGYQIYQDEWKVMGLAACGKPSFAPQVRRLIYAEDGLFKLDLSYFNFQYADKDVWYGPKFIEAFGPPRRGDEPIDAERFADLAASFQLVTEEIGLGVVRHLLKRGGRCRKLCMAGGVALNAVLNGKILAETEVEELFVQPAAGDAGAALGAALYVHHAVLEGKRSAPMFHASLGPEYSESEVAQALAASGVVGQKCSDVERRAALMISEGKVIAWFQGRMEYGPRALGNRSILADPRRAEMKAILNAKVKFREAFRPFAPAILAEHVNDFFERGGSYPFMTVVLPVKKQMRSVIPAVTHHDGTARLQTVEQSVNPRFYRLISEFNLLTGVPVVVNTSFNLQGEPIVCSPADAISTYLRSGLDALVIGDFVCTKSS